MAGTRAQRKPTFWWQAALILLPVVVLATVGLYSLRQDRTLAEREAQERARGIAEDLLPRIWQLITNPPAGQQLYSFQINKTGELVFPPPYSEAPTPAPLDPGELEPKEAQLWLKLQNLEALESSEKLSGFHEFIASNPPHRFLAIAHYSRALLLLDEGRFAESVEEFQLVRERFPEAVSEAGLPLQTLALVHLWGFAREADDRISLKPPRGRNLRNLFDPRSLASSTPLPFVSFEALCSNLVNQPTPLTPFLLRTLGSEPEVTSGASGTLRVQWPSVEQQEQLRKWQQLWDDHEISRALFSAASSESLRQSNVEAVAPIRPQFPAGISWPVLDVRNPARVPARLFWFSTQESLTVALGDPDLPRVSESRWLALRAETGTDAWIHCRSEAAFGMALEKLERDQNRIPEHFGIEVVIAGRKLSAFAPDLRMWEWVRQGGKEGSYTKQYDDALASTVLASARGAGESRGVFQVNVYLTSPAEVFKRQQMRTFWFGALVIASAAAALIGLAAAWRVFQEQLQLNDMKSNFVSSVSHELRAPIASVRLMAESLERGKVADPEKRNDYFRFIGQECRRLSSLIENVLDFSRIEQGRKRYEFEPTDVLALTRETVKRMECYAAEKGVHLAFHSNLDPRNRELEVDGRAIQQALVNLIDNAIKHSPKGETVTVEVEIPDSNGRVPVFRADEMALIEESEMRNPPAPQAALNPQPSVIRLSVADRGPGIPPEEHEKIFERFYRRGSELRRETQGVGIGLSIVKHIIEAHGGRVRVESEVARGSRFTIELAAKPLNR